METAELMALLIILGLLFTAVAVFPKIEFFFVRLWVRSKDPKSDIEPTKLFIVWTRVVSSVAALALFGLAGALIAIEHRDARAAEACEELLLPLQERLFDDELIYEDDLTGLEDEFGVRISPNFGVLDGEYYVSATVQHDDFRLILLPDTDIPVWCAAG